MSKLDALRNEAAHSYNEAVAEKIYRELKKALDHFGTLLDAVKEHE